VHGFYNLQGHPPLLTFVSREPNSGEATSTELMHNSVALGIKPIAEVNGMKPPWLVFLDVFRVADTLGKEEASVIGFFRV